MVESLWVIPEIANLRTPLSILREQAAALTEQTKGTLVGIVETRNLGDRMEIRLEISVPALNDYRFRILIYLQPFFDLYPGILFNDAESELRIGDEESLVGALKTTLSSNRIKNVLASLLSQAVAA